jgi:chromate reductase, NAD(P)H dehydrogenase (quinone)
VISALPRALGAIGANHHLRHSLVFLNAPAMQQPEAGIGEAASLFDAEGKLTNESTRGFLRRFLQSFAARIDASRKRQSALCHP